MNAKQFLVTLGAGALGIALVALPGSSARKSDPAASASAAQQIARAGALQDPPRHVPGVPGDVENLDLAVLPFVEGDEDVQVIVNSGEGWLGVGIAEVNADKAKELKLPAERGVLLGKIVPESPAARAGLKESDVITEVNGQRIEGTEQFRRMIREIPAGRAAQVSIWRDGHTQTLSVTLGKSEPRHIMTHVAPAAPGSFAFSMPDMSQMGQLLGNGMWGSSGPRLGIDAENLEGEFGEYFGAPEGEGILVRGVFPDTPAAKAGLKVGDVITSLDGDRIHSVGELREKLVEKKEAKDVKLGVLRNKAALSLSVELPRPAEKKEHRSGVRTNI